MKQSRLFTKTRKEAPSDEMAKNAQLLIRAGYVYKEMAGVYTLLPLGLKVVEKISAIIREEMNLLGSTEIQSSVLQKSEPWKKTDRWSDEKVDNWFKTRLKNDTELGLAFTHEEALTHMMRDYVHSYKDLPQYLYDIKTVFRNETRSKSGLMRGREFFWKALYSFSQDKEQHQQFYEKITHSYHQIFKRVGLGDSTYLTFASGGTFAQYSHEFQTLCEAGEDTIYLDEERGIAVNQEVYTDEVLKDLALDRSKLIEKKAVEVGNIFSLGSIFSEPLGLQYQDQEAKTHPVYMGSYGIGISRLLGVIAEKFSDDNGLMFPESIAPFKVHLITFGDNEAIFREAESLYHDLTSSGIEVLFDDRSGVNAGEKFRDADLIGIPYRLVLSERSVGSGGVELTHRKNGDVQFMDTTRVLAHLSQD